MPQYQVELGSVNRNTFGESSRRFKEESTELSGLLTEKVSRTEPIRAMVFFNPDRDEAFAIEDDRLETIRKRVETDDLAKAMVVTAITRYTSLEE